MMSDSSLVGVSADLDRSGTQPRYRQSTESGMLASRVSLDGSLGVSALVEQRPSFECRQQDHGCLFS